MSAAKLAGIQWLPEEWDDRQIEKTLFPQRSTPAVWRKHAEPRLARIHRELQTHKEILSAAIVTAKEPAKRIPEEVRLQPILRPIPALAEEALDLVQGQEHRARRRVFVDYAGATIPIYDHGPAKFSRPCRGVRGGVGRQQLHVR